MKKSNHRNTYGVKNAADSYRVVDGINYMQWADGDKEECERIKAEDEIRLPGNKFIIRKVSSFYRVYKSVN